MFVNRVVAWDMKKMIRKISGSLERVEPTAIELAVGSIVHEVLVPDMVRSQLQAKLGRDSLYTLETSRAIQHEAILCPES